MAEIPRSHERPGTGAENIPPGATRKAFDRPLNPPRGSPGSGAGPRHASGDPGDGNEFNDNAARHHEDLAPDIGYEPPEEEPAYGGPSGGAVGGTPAGGRSSGGHMRHGFDPGADHRGDSTLGADPAEKTVD